MYNQYYEVSCTITSIIIIISSTYILIITSKYMVIFIILSGIASCLTRLYRIKWKEYIMDDPIVYVDILFAIMAFCTYIIEPFTVTVYYPIIAAFILMIIAAIMSWNIFPFKLVEESFVFQLLGHIIISISLIYTAIEETEEFNIQ